MSARLAGVFSRSGISGPASSGQEADAVWCIATGRLEGLTELASDLGLESAAPTETVLATAFSRWREAMLERLGGSFGLLVWDGTAGLLAVDPLGSGSLFFHDDGGRLRFATEVVDLLRLLPEEPGPDERALVRWIVSGTVEPDQTLYAGVGRLPGGCHLRLADGRWSMQRHWRPRFTGVAHVTLEEAGVSVRSELERSVEAQCGGRAAGVLLSGGLDSTSVAGVAAASGRTSMLRAYSAIFPADAAADESEFVEIAVEALGIPSSRQSAEASGVLEASAEHVRDWRLPAASPNVFFQRPLLERARENGVEVVLDGQGGDELFGSSPYLLGDLLRGFRLRSLRARSRELAEGDASAARALRRTYALRGAAPRWLHTVSRLRRHPPLHWLTPSAAALSPDRRPPWLTLDGPRWWAWLADTLTAGRERMGVYDHLRRKLASDGLTGAHPLLDDLRLIELVLRLSPELAYDEDLDRPVLRESMRGLVPEPIRLRRTKSVFNTLLVDALSGPDRAQLRSLLELRDAEIRAYVTDSRLRDVVDGPIAHDHPYLWARSAWRLASTELWLRSLS